ncbi:Molybdenum cofactor biosynthesis protein MoaD [Methanosarcina lacustris Z-7289]|uniref:Molybdenum cofactor biosynthesis protein MoaD n=1 Tax=Methanosarcina lacustris Z-7289 TaxID=1434111 RepID=A0A0E3S3D9_9EURY|nr:MoaD/ThiS family protein [Methanosarcina lacustris]AKB74681.1 Molybdenum cofactor biosynthesis protein MoaD [Methanosarcina lacustris Z-7289]
MIMLVKFLESVQEITRQQEISVKIGKGDTVQTVLFALAYNYGHDFYAVTIGDESETPKVRIMLNGRDIGYLNGFETDVKGGDVLVLSSQGTLS